MIYIKSLLVSLGVALLCIGGYLLFFYTPAYELDAALEAFQVGDYKKTEYEFSKLDKAFPKDQLRLYEAYLYRGQNRLNHSNVALNEAEMIAKNGSNESVLLEVYLNQVYNAYLIDDPKSYDVALSKAWSLKRDNEWVNFFGFIGNFCKGNYNETVDVWEKHFPKKALSGWMEKSFKETFTSSWFLLRVARCQLEESKYATVRQYLEERINHATGRDFDEINLLLGLTYVKEAQGKLVEEAIPIYEKAFSYFYLVSLNQRHFSKEREHIIQHVSDIANTFIDEHRFGNLPFFVSALEQWKANDQLQTIATKLVNLLNSDLQENKKNQAQEIAETIAELTSYDAMGHAITNQLSILSHDSMKSGDVRSLTELWKLISQTNPHLRSLMSSLAQEAQKNILASLPKDNKNFGASKPYFNLWNTLEQNQYQRDMFAYQLLTVSSTMWHRDGQEQKALGLMRLAFSICCAAEKVEMQNSIGKVIQQVYDRATMHNQMTKLPYILEAVDTMHLSGINLQDSQAIENHLEDARFLLEEQHEEEAGIIADWILKIEPENQKAIKIAGLASYALGDYPKAYRLLKKLPHHSEQIAESLAISQIVAGTNEEQKVALDYLKENKQLTEDTFLRLGLALLVVDKPSEGLQWLAQLSKPSQEIYTALVVAAYKLKQWQLVVDYYYMLTSPYNKFEGILGMYIVAVGNLGEIAIAEESLHHLMNIPVPNSHKNYSRNFAAFKERSIDTFDMNSIASTFFNDVKHEPQIALEYLQKVENPSHETLLKKVELLITLQQWDMASISLAEVAQNVRNETLQQQLKPLKATLLAHFEQNLEAFALFKNYFAHQSADNRFRPAYVELLLNLQRYDLALEQLALLKKQNNASVKDLVNEVEALVFTNQFSTASANAIALFQRKPPIGFADQFKLTRFLAIVNENDVVDDLMKNIPENSQNFSVDETIELLKLFMQRGAYEKASTLAYVKQNELRNSAKGLFTLAQLQERLSLSNEALIFAKHASELDPFDIEIQDFISFHETDVKQLEKRRETLAKLVEKSPHPDSELAYAKVIISEALAHQRKKTEMTNKVELLMNSQALLQKMVLRFIDIPEIYFHLAQCQFLLEKNDQIVELQNKALQYDIAYVDAYELKAIVQENLQQTNGAIDSIKTALKYAPDNAVAWHMLYEFYKSRDVTFEAINSLKQAILFRPNDIKNYIEIGNLYLKISNPENAGEAFEKALKLDGNNVEALKLLLTALYHPNVLRTTENVETLKAHQKLVYDKLHQLDPQAADSL